MFMTGRNKQTALIAFSILLLSQRETLAQATDVPALDTGDTAWMLISTALVLMMTIPGLALFYGGMVRRKNVLSTVMQSFAIACLMSVLWMVAGYSLVFTDGGSMNAFIGSLSKAFFAGVSMQSLTGTIPEYLFITFQMTFAIITPALIAGSFAERMKFSSMLVFLTLWLFIVYVPVAHWVWGGGFLGSDGVLDFAGGTVVHINAGVAGLVAALIIGKRDGYGHTNMAPHNLVLSVIGAALLWVGWFGFNAGSAAGANALAAVAMLNTQVATAGAALAWMLVEWAISGKPSVLGIISGAIAGLVAITPAAGFVNPTGALFLGIIAGAICYVAAVKIKHALGYDDSLDAFGVHGVGGFIGAILTGVFADAAINPAAAEATIAKQFFGAAITIVYTAIATAIILYAIKAVMGLRVGKQAEIEGLDIALHGESVH
ncbi:ammonium transporter [Falsochrobactrum shanghaiense]|uniref:Ammonium transporter n=1 Tax=Falsochrobactrum shanghaiense TaxID=2201899 RepID=A0A316JGG9_9HYPH|nr:ammonium transporter [Falsochrobactrum shanghaiense]PWL19675.1 ammonium transporter [Falsochrobactrum shanghaiense]